MTESEKKTKQDRFTPAVIACALLIGAAIFASLLWPAPSPAPIENPAARAGAFSPQRFGVWEGQVARFEQGTDTPAEVYDTAVASLPPDIQARLEVGILVEDEETFNAWLDDLAS